MRGWGGMGRFSIVLAITGVLSLSPAVTTATAAAPCTHRVLVLSAFPAELDAVLTRARHRAPRPIVAGGHNFYLGRLGRHDVVMAMTGIGPVNARETTEAAVGRFTCGTASAITAVVFSGVAGSTHRIGDVTVPRRWTDDDGASWLDVDPAMFAAAHQLAAEAPPVLLQDNPGPDPLCLCTSAIRTVHFPYAPQVFVGGDGVTTDPFGGRAFPCVPGGGDVFGCRACHGRPGAPPDVVGFLTGILPFADGQFIVGYLNAPESAVADAAAADNETAAVGRVATAHHIPFIGFRGVSDGAGDPLMLPGFPVQFFTYYPISAANAATTAAAFLQRW